MMMNSIINDDVMNVFPDLDDESAQIIIADPPYNIGKDFGDGKYSKELDKYLDWCEEWITQCLRILKSNGTLFIYGFSEILAFVRTRVPLELECRWLIWHYTNKQVPSLNFWQRSHESILAISKNKKERIFHRDEVREPYTDAFLNNAAGKVRKSTKGRFSSGKKETTYNAHKKGALPRDVIKIGALAGGAGLERVSYCKTCEEALKGKEKKEHEDQGHEIEVHQTQKPLELCEKLIVSCRQDDGYLFVPFVGTGSECVSAKKLGVPFIGVEKNPIYVKLSNSRLIKFADDSDIEDKNSRQTNIGEFSKK